MTIRFVDRNSSPIFLRLQALKPLSFSIPVVKFAGASPLTAREMSDLKVDFRSFRMVETKLLVFAVCGQSSPSYVIM